MKMSKTYEDAKKFAAQFIQPYSAETDEKAVFPKESFRKMGEHGYFRLLIPQEKGGLGKNIQDHADVCMAFSESSATAGLCYMMHNVALMCVLNYGSAELKAKICGDIIDNKRFMALAYSEFGTGTHFYIPEVKARAKGNKVVFNGVKSMVTSAEDASYYLVLAPSDQGGINNWIFPLETKGVTFQLELWNGLGMRGNASCPMKLDNAELDALYRIGAEGSGLEQVLSVVAPYFILGLASVYTGICLNLLEVTADYSQKRKYPDGQALCGIETVQIHLAGIYTKTLAAKSLTLEAARAAMAGDADVLAKILAARISASESAIECARIAMRVGGGKAYNKGIATERLLRDAFAGQIMAPSVDVLNIWLGKALTGQPIP
jgi:alkylation response protein AidB-like acyl-CoA dehydrogenase